MIMDPSVVFSSKTGSADNVAESKAGCGAACVVSFAVAPVASLVFLPVLLQDSMHSTLIPIRIINVVFFILLNVIISKLSGRRR